MKFLIISDTHGYLKNVIHILDRLQDKLYGVIHLGDHDTDAEALESKYSDLKFYYVKGNNDYSGSADFEKIIQLYGRKVLLTHGHKQHVHWNYDKISYYAQEQGVELALFGHTHVPLNDRGGPVWLFNPGSISLPRGSMIPTFGIMDVMENGKFELCVMQYLGKDDFKQYRQLPRY